MSIVDLSAFKGIVSVSEAVEPKMSAPAAAPPPQLTQPASNSQVGGNNSEHHDDGVRGRSEGRIVCGENKMKFDRHQRALVRALAKRAKWDQKEIAAVFRVSLAIIQKTVTNGYVAVDDIVSEDANYYTESEFRKLNMERPPPRHTPEKKKGRKKLDKTFAKKSTRKANPVPRRQYILASPPASVPMEVELNLNTSRDMLKMFRDEAKLVHGDKVHSVLEEAGIEDDETMIAVLNMDDERLNNMLQEAKPLKLVEKFSVIQAMRDFGKKHEYREVERSRSMFPIQ
ncbi:hypothetical protein EDB19DRAFT_1967384 [Suillus lakei]|nr:hypothetical protein EDB19DRAFT_1967384 [Suillus lakei]